MRLATTAAATAMIGAVSSMYNRQSREVKPVPAQPDPTGQRAERVPEMGHRRRLRPAAEAGSVSPAATGPRPCGRQPSGGRPTQPWRRCRRWPVGSGIRRWRHAVSCQSESAHRPSRAHRARRSAVRRPVSNLHPTRNVNEPGQGTIHPLIQAPIGNTGVITPG